MCSPIGQIEQSVSLHLDDNHEHPPPYRCDPRSISNRRRTIPISESGSGSKRPIGVLRDSRVWIADLRRVNLLNDTLWRMFLERLQHLAIRGPDGRVVWYHIRHRLSLPFGIPGRWSNVAEPTRRWMSGNRVLRPGYDVGNRHGLHGRVLRRLFRCRSVRVRRIISLHEHVRQLLWQRPGNR